LALSAEIYPDLEVFSAMMKRQFLYRALICALIICSCTVEMNQTLETPAPAVTHTTPSTSIFPATQVPVTWAHLNLAGKLVYLSSTMEGEQLTSTVQVLDLVSGTATTIFSAPGAWAYYATISPDAKTLAMSYVPPKDSNSSSGRSLYVIPLDASTEAQPLFTPPTPDDHYIQVEWSPDGTYLYYVHYNSQIRIEDQLDPIYDILRMRYPDGQPEKIADHAFWPRVSPDSSKLVYIFVDPDTARNELFVANADGSNSQRVELSGPQTPEIIDAPIFSPDGQSILFSAPEPSQSHQPNFFEKLMGIQVAKAHDVPSDWWSVPITGGIPSQLTNLQTINLFASISPDQKHIASLSGEGIFVMDLDGSNLTQLVSDPGVHGTVSWIP
jgi:Tol biopolymer transport system component